MKLNWYFMNETFELVRDDLNSIVLEHPDSFSRFAEEMNFAIKSQDSFFQFEEEGIIEDLAHRGVVINSPYELELEKKSYQKYLYAILSKELHENQKEYEIAEAYGNLVEKVFEFLSESEFELSFLDDLGVMDLFKKLDVQIRFEEGPLTERLLNYTLTERKLTGKNLFFLVNMLPYFTKDSLLLLQKQAQYEQLTYIFISQYQRPENVFINEYIVDSDLCVIH